jgi:hypothetical protein
MAAAHPRGDGKRPGCDDQYEFEFALDLVLDGTEVLHTQQWSPGA